MSLDDVHHVANLINGLIDLETMRTLKEKTEGLAPGQQQWILRNVKQTQRQAFFAIENNFETMEGGVDAMVKCLHNMTKEIASTPNAVFVPEGTNVMIANDAQTNTSIIVTFFRTMDESEVDEAITMSLSKF